MKKKTYTVAAYTINGHFDADEPGESLLDYSVLDEVLGTAANQRFRPKIEGVRVGIDEMFTDSTLIGLRFVAENPFEDKLAVDQNTGVTRTGILGDGEVFGDYTWVYVHPSTRFVAIERRRPGVSKSKIERFIELALEHQLDFGSSTITITPIILDTFVQELSGFTRIQSAAISVSRPNPGFADNLKTMLARTAMESEAKRAEIKVVSEDRRSLRKDSGLVDDIREFAAQEFQSIQKATIEGEHSDHEGRFKLDSTGHVLLDRFEELAYPQGAQLAQRLLESARRLYKKHLDRLAGDGQ